MAAFEAVLSLRWIRQTDARGEAKISLPPFVPFFAALILVAGCSVRSAPSAQDALAQLLKQRYEQLLKQRYETVDKRANRLLSEARRILELGDEIRPANGEWVELCDLITGYR